MKLLLSKYSEMDNGIPIQFNALETKTILIKNE